METHVREALEEARAALSGAQALLVSMGVRGDIGNISLAIEKLNAVLKDTEQ